MAGAHVMAGAQVSPDATTPGPRVVSNSVASSTGSEMGEGLTACGGVLVVDPHAPVECVGWDTYS